MKPQTQTQTQTTTNRPRPHLLLLLLAAASTWPAGCGGQQRAADQLDGGPTTSDLFAGHELNHFTGLEEPIGPEMGAHLAHEHGLIAQRELATLQLNSSAGGHSSRPETIAHAHAKLRCSRSSIIASRQMLGHQFEQLNSFNTFWFNDLDREELIESQKQALASIILSGFGRDLISADLQPTFELEASYFRSPIAQRGGLNGTGSGRQLSQTTPTTQNSAASPQAINMKVMRRHQDRCQVSQSKGTFTYQFGLTLGPIEHNLDLIYRLPKKLVLSQPLEWRFAQLRLQVQQMAYEVTLRQPLEPRLLLLAGGCPIELADVTFIAGASSRPQLSSLSGSGLANDNQTKAQLERLFADYTRPAVSSRLRQLLRFYLNAKTLPLRLSA